MHHVGSASPATVAALAARHPEAGVPADVELLRDAYAFTDFAHFIDVYLCVVDLLRTPEDIRLLTYEVIEGLAARQVRYAEVTMTPYTSVIRGIPIEAYTEAIEDARVAAERDHGVVVRWIYDIPGEAGLESADAGLNQALIFYHFGSVAELIEAASDEAVDLRLAHYRTKFDGAQTLAELLALAHELHDTERAEGTVRVMAQLMAGAPGDPVIARATRRALAAWTGEVERTLRRLLEPTPLAEVTDPAGLAQLITATFVGIELVDGADADAAAGAFTTIERLNDLVTRLERLAPLPAKAVRAAIRRSNPEWRQ